MPEGLAPRVAQQRVVIILTDMCVYIYIYICIIVIVMYVCIYIYIYILVHISNTNRLDHRTGQEDLLDRPRIIISPNNVCVCVANNVCVCVWLLFHLIISRAII